MFTKEDYVSLETAKMLKEKGFDLDCLAFYKDGEFRFVRSEWEGENIDTLALQSRGLRLDRDNQGDALAPTLYEAQKWILSRGLYVCPKIYENKGWYYTINKVKRGELFHSYLSIAKDLFPSLPQALDAGIRKALELIKEDWHGLQKNKKTDRTCI